MSLHHFTAHTLEGEPHSLSHYKDKVLLIVNTASACGFTPQYDGLEKLHRSHKDRGLVVLGFPSNDFGGQEPGGSPEIRKFCSSRFGVSFPLFEKTKTRGPGQSPIYKFLSAVHGEPEWNFHKYLVGKDGQVRRAFSSRVSPGSAELHAAIESALAE